VTDKLGIAAKIAADSDFGRERLICVYTRDFSDINDVRRVAQSLLDLDLISGDGSRRPIYYKCDMYTHLGINSGNEYGLAASLYNSHEVLSLYLDGKVTAATWNASTPNAKKQATLDMFRGKSPKDKARAI
jgi:Domain of unknown function (DUF1917)